VVVVHDSPPPRALPALQRGLGRKRKVKEVKGR
jgi:hypothetical protein